MAKVIIKGSGQRNGTVIINLSIEMDNEAAKIYVGANRDQALVALLALHYPGVKVNTKQLNVVVNPN